MIVLNYDRKLAVKYALLWANKRNNKYYNFDNLGGDCTNFISQCIYSGSGIMNYQKTFGWYYENLNNRAPAWSGVEQLHNFLTKNNGVGPFGKIIEVKDAQIGDVIQISSGLARFTHSLLITNISNGNVYVCTHTIDALNRPLNSYSYTKIRAIHILGVRK